MADNEKVDDAPSRKSTTWLVKKGDTLVEISRAVYGTGDYWMYIYNANRGKIHNADYIDPLIGTTIDIPPIRNNPVNGETAVAFSHKGAKFWTIQYGDTLVGISKAVYGTTKYSRFLYEANSEIIEKPDSLKKLVGYPLIIPQNPDEPDELPPEFALGVDFDKNKYNYSLIIQHGNSVFQPAVEDGIKVEWSRDSSPGKLTFTVLKSATETYLEGDQVKFYYNKRLVFVGYVFKKHRTKKGHIETIAYDQTRYLKNKFAYLFQDKTTSEIIKELCKDFDLKVGYIEDSKYKIPAIAEENSEAFDIILGATEETLANTGEMFTLFDMNGAITYKNVLNMKTDTLITATTAEDFDYTSSIDDKTYNRIILYYKPSSTGGFTDASGGTGTGINAGGKLPPYQTQQQAMGASHRNGGGWPYNCTWYAGDRLEQLGVHLSGAMGHGGQWANNAASQGFKVYYGQPFVGAGACMIGGLTQGISWLSAYGHIAIVEDVYEDGSILCSEFYGGDYSDGGILHTNKYSALSASTMKFIDFGVRVNSGGEKPTATAKPKSSIITSQKNSNVTLKGKQGVLGPNVTRWANYILHYSSMYNVPPDIVGAIIKHESGGDPNAKNPGSTASGLMQMINTTWQAMGVKNPFDPQQAIEGGCKLLAYLKHYKGGNYKTEQVLKGYACGETMMNSACPVAYEFLQFIPNEFTGMSGTCTTLDSIEDGSNATVQVFKAEDKDSMNRWGVLQYFEQVQSDGIGQDKADALLKLYNRKSREFKINDALGNVDVRGGSMIPVYLNIGDTIVNNYMLVDRVTHKFYHHKHTMDLELEGAYHD